MAMNLGCEKQLVAHLMCEALPICFGGIRLLLFNVLNEFPHTTNMERSLKKGGEQESDCMEWSFRRICSVDGHHIRDHLDLHSIR